MKQPYADQDALAKIIEGIKDEVVADVLRAALSNCQHTCTNWHSLGRHAPNCPVDGVAGAASELPPADLRMDLLDLIKRHCVRSGEFTSASGAKSGCYIDCSRILTLPEGLHLVGDLMYGMLQGESVDAIGGPALGAVPIVCCLLARFHAEGRSISGFFVHTEGIVEGHVPRCGKVVIVDDVVTTGRSMKSAIEAARDAGASPVRALCIVDRRDASRKEDLEVESLFTLQDVVPSRSGAGGQE